VDPRRARHPRAYGVALDVSQRRHRMRIVHRARMEAALPQVSCAAMQLVYALREDEVRAPDGEVKRIVTRGNGNEVNVVGHQAIAEDAHVMLAALRPQNVEIGNAVIVHKKHVLPVVPALGNMVRETRNHHAGLSWHDGRLM